LSVPSRSRVYATHVVANRLQGTLFSASGYEFGVAKSKFPPPRRVVLAPLFSIRSHSHESAWYCSPPSVHYATVGDAPSTDAPEADIVTQVLV
jgi:hypothetical protein